MSNGGVKYKSLNYPGRVVRTLPRRKPPRLYDYYSPRAYTFVAEDGTEDRIIGVGNAEVRVSSREDACRQYRRMGKRITGHTRVLPGGLV